MKQLFTFIAIGLYCSIASAQADTIKVGNMTIIKKGGVKKEEGGISNISVPADTINAKKITDTIRIGNIVIVNDRTYSDKNEQKEDEGGWRYWSGRRERSSNVSTNWLILDLGFSNYINNTSGYSNGGGYLYNRAGAAPLGENDFELNTGKSINVNIWLFMQRLNLIKHHVHLKYGLGVELNNYRYNSAISFLKENPFETGVAPAPTVIRDSISFKKNKLAADYLTVPVMLSYSTHPYNQNKGFSISFGVSAGYLYSQRNKQISNERGKQKTKDGIGLEQLKFAYVGEVGLGPVRLYGSYSPDSFFKDQLDMRPYTLGIRFSNW